MNDIGLAELGRTPTEGKGFPTLMPAEWTYRLRRTALAVAATVAFGAAIGGTNAAIEGHADAGVLINSSGVVESVSRTGFAWRDGIRPGQQVISTQRADAADGWSIVTSGPSGPIKSREAPLVDALHGVLPIALLGLASGCLALAFLRINRDWALPASSVALVLSSVPLFLANQWLSAPTLAVAALLPAVWAIWRLRRRRVVAASLALGGVAALAAWLAGYVSGEGPDALDQLRRAVAWAGTGLVMADRVLEHRPSRVEAISRLHAVSILAVAVVIAAGLALVYFAGIPAPLVAIAIVAGILAVEPLRTMIGRRLELALLADLRAQVSADVVEEERGRIARELHDAPLQELSAVIRKLELIPGAGAETRSLMNIANELRSVAIDLRPPMLDDLGLGAALDYIAEQTTSSKVRVLLALEDSTGLEPSRRPPPAVEFALYRIVREAVTNAIKHAEATQVRIAGDIAMSSVDLSIKDDGKGIARETSRGASGRGRLGLASMRRRAQAIDADLSIGGTDSGTEVVVRWRL
jgi:signal transduction histidine kinase